LERTHALPFICQGEQVTWVERERESERVSSYMLNRCVLTDKLVSTYDPQAYGPTPFSPRGFPRFLSIRGARGLLALNQVLI
jgi:hypothetical protein